MILLDYSTKTPFLFKRCDRMGPSFLRETRVILREASVLVLRVIATFQREPGEHRSVRHDFSHVDETPDHTGQPFKGLFASTVTGLGVFRYRAIVTTGDTMTKDCNANGNATSRYAAEAPTYKVGRLWLVTPANASSLPVSCCLTRTGCQGRRFVQLGSGGQENRSF